MNDVPGDGAVRDRDAQRRVGVARRMVGGRWRGAAQLAARRRSVVRWPSSRPLPCVPLLSRRSSTRRTSTSAACSFYPSAAYVLVALGLNVVVGLAGLLDLGYVGFFAIGAYTDGVLGSAARQRCRGCSALPHRRSPWPCRPACCSGAPTLRLRGDYLAIVTLGFGEIIRITANNLRLARRGRRGINGHPRPPPVASAPLKLRRARRQRRTTGWR